MSRRKRASASTPVKSQAHLRRTVFCPACGTMTKYVTTKAHQHVRDKRGVLVEVTRVFYCCPNGNCRTPLWFNYREDGQIGDLAVELAIDKIIGRRPQGLGGKFGELV